MRNHIKLSWNFAQSLMITTRRAPSGWSKLKRFESKWYEVLLLQAGYLNYSQTLSIISSTSWNIAQSPHFLCKSERRLGRFVGFGKGSSIAFPFLTSVFYNGRICEYPPPPDHGFFPYNIIWCFYGVLSSFFRIDRKIKINPPTTRKNYL